MQHEGTQGISAFPSLLAAFALLPLLGRLLLAYLPPGRVGSHRVQDLAETLYVSCLLGWWLGNVPLELAIETLPQLLPAWVLPGGIALLALARLALRPHALVPQHELPRPRWGWLESSLALALVAAGLWPLEDLLGLGSLVALERLAGAAVIVMASSNVARAVECAGRPTAIGLGAALATLAPRSPLGSAGIPELFALQALVLFAATSVTGWLRRADPRDRALALFASGVLVGIDVRLGTAGLLATLLATHSNALKATFIAALLAVILVALPTCAAVVQGTAPFDDSSWVLARWGNAGVLALPLGLTVALVVASLIVRARERRAGSRGLFAPPGREVGALALFCALPLALGALELVAPPLALPYAAPLGLPALARIVAPAAVFLGAITLAPMRRP